MGGVVLALGFSSVALGDHSGSRYVFVGTCVGEGSVSYPQQTLVIEGRRKGEANGNIVPINGPRVIERADERPGARTVIFDIEFTTEPRGIVG